MYIYYIVYIYIILFSHSNNGILSFTTIWTEVEDIKFGSKRHRKPSTPFISFVWKILN